MSVFYSFFFFNEQLKLCSWLQTSWTWGRSQNGQRSPDDSAVATISVKGADARFQPPTANRIFRLGLIFFRSLNRSYQGKQHFHQMLIMCKLDHRLMKRRREKGENCCEGISFKIPPPMTGYIMHPLLDWFFFKNWSSGFWLSLGNTLTPASTPRLH